MADNIPPTYASPNMRWALLLFDHPGAFYSAALHSAEVAGIPAEWSNGQKLCVVTIHFPPDSGLEAVSAFKPAVANRKGPDEWNILVTKTLGRALKKAGYPDDMLELKALMFWRQRTAEVDRLAITAGTAPMELDSGELDNAGRHEPDDVGADDAGAEGISVTGDGALREELRERINAMLGEEKRELSQWAKSVGIPNILMPTGIEQVCLLLERITGVAEAVVVDG